MNLKFLQLNKALHPTAYSFARSSLRFRRRVSLSLGGNSVALYDLQIGKISWRAQTSRFAQFARFIEGDAKIRVVVYGGQHLMLDARTGRQISSSRLSTQFPDQTGALSPDGKTLASFYYGPNRNSLRDAASGKVKVKIAAPEDFLLSTRFSRDGTLLGTAMMGDFNPKTLGKTDFLRFFNAKTGKMVREIPAFSVQGYGTRTLEEWNFSGDGKFVAASGINILPKGKGFAAIKIWDARNGTLLKTLHFAPNTMGAVAFSADSKTLFAVKNGSQIVAFDWRQARIVRASNAAQAPSIGRFEFAPDGRLVVLGGERLHVFDFQSSQLQASLWKAPFYQKVEATILGDGKKFSFQKPLAGALVSDFSFSVGGDILATSGAAEQIFNWKSGALMQTLPLVKFGTPTTIKGKTYPPEEAGIEKIAVSSDGQHLLEARSSSFDSFARAYASVRQPPPSQQLWMRHRDGKSRQLADKVDVLALQFSPSGQKFAAILRVESGEKEVEGQRPNEVQLRVYDLAGQLLWTAKNQGDYRANIAWPREDVLLTGSFRGRVFRFDAATGAAKKVLPNENSFVQTLGEGGHVVVEDRAGLQIVDVSSDAAMEEEGAILPLASGGNSAVMAISDDGKRLAIGNSGAQISIYDATDGAKIGQFSFLPSPRLDDPQWIFWRDDGFWRGSKDAKLWAKRRVGDALLPLDVNVTP